ncbi:prenyltransferase [Methanobacterium veterum]|uniref:Prenyltransferase n=2 Tax=Methanobacterium veterum TaxID=408577 RepID=A0A9E5DKD1_9EURY|nr:prenyltransferase [Methanobacterium veterum]MCZ3364540.1 prenyltransferase [Methanobacterium veterum]
MPQDMDFFLDILNSIKKYLCNNLFNNIMKIDGDALIKIVKLGRPVFLFDGFLLFIMGALLAVIFNAEFSLTKFIMGYSILLLCHLAVHYSNDYYDFKTDSLSGPSTVSAGSGILLENPELKQFSKGLAIALNLLSVVLAAVFIIIFSYPIEFFLLAVFGNFLAWFYTAPPLKLAYNRLGEVSNALYGILLPSAGFFTLMGMLTIPMLIFTIPLAFSRLFLTNSANIPDMEGDKLGGKITLIVANGRRFGFKFIGISAFMMTLSFALISFTGLYPQVLNFKVLTFISVIPLSLGIMELLKMPSDRELATKYATFNIKSIFLIGLLINSYFAFLILS